MENVNIFYDVSATLFCMTRLTTPGMYKTTSVVQLYFAAVENMYYSDNIDLNLSMLKILAGILLVNQVSYSSDILPC